MYVFPQTFHNHVSIVLCYYNKYIFHKMLLLCTAMCQLKLKIDKGNASYMKYSLYIIFQKSKFSLYVETTFRKKTIHSCIENTRTLYYILSLYLTRLLRYTSFNRRKKDYLLKVVLWEWRKESERQNLIANAHQRFNRHMEFNRRHRPKLFAFSCLVGFVILA